MRPDRPPEQPRPSGRPLRTPRGPGWLGSAVLLVLALLFLGRTPASAGSSGVCAWLPPAQSVDPDPLDPANWSCGRVPTLEDAADLTQRPETYFRLRNRTLHVGTLNARSRILVAGEHAELKVERPQVGFGLYSLELEDGGTFRLPGKLVLEHLSGRLFGFLGGEGGGWAGWLGVPHGRGCIGFCFFFRIVFDLFVHFSVRRCG